MTYFERANHCSVNDDRSRIAGWQALVVGITLFFFVRIGDISQIEVDRSLVVQLYNVSKRFGTGTVAFHT